VAFQSAVEGLFQETGINRGRMSKRGGNEPWDDVSPVLGKIAENMRESCIYESQSRRGSLLWEAYT